MALVTQYREEWADDFARIRTYLESGISSYTAIEHIGSTSIPGMVAKPIIDIIIVAQAGKMSLLIQELAALQYRHQGDLGVPGREAFDYLPPHVELPRHHLYASYADNPQLKGSVAFRDFLRNNSAFRKQLSDLKLELDKKHNSNRQLYMDSKRELVERIIRIALRNQAGADLDRTISGSKKLSADAQDVRW